MLKIELSAEDSFWKERMIRYINECDSMEELKEVSKMLVSISVTRQSAIKGLVRENAEILGKGLTNWIDKTQDPDWMSKVERPNPYPGKSEQQS